MQRIENISYGRELKVVTSRGTYSGPMELRIHADGIECRRDIDFGWVKVSDKTMTLEELKTLVEEWINSGPPRDIDDRVIPFEI